jgi:hypothetical protein
VGDGDKVGFTADGARTGEFVAADAGQQPTIA